MPWHGAIKTLLSKSLGKYDEAIRAFDEAIRAFDEAIRLDPENANTQNNKSNALIRQGKYDEAIRLDPELAAA